MKRSRLIIALALAAAVPVGCLMVERNAESAAQALCRQFPPGSDYQEALKVAATQGERRLATADSITVLYVGVPPFSRYNCEIRGTNGKVAATRVFHLD